MVLKSKICLLLLFSLSLLLALVSVSHSYEYDEPEQELHRCQLHCVRQLQPYSKQAECQEQCVKVYKERKEERGSFEDPQSELKRCQKQCQEQEHSQQQQCRIRCQREYEQQQREQEERARREGGGGRGDENPQVEDPQQRYEQCQEQCRRSHRGEQERCQNQCRKEYQRQLREQEEHEHGEGSSGRRDDNRQVEDPQQQYEQCQEQCRTSHRGEQERCQIQCRKEYQRQQREKEERERREGGRGRGDDNPQVEDPQQRYEQCQEQCRGSHRGEQEQCHSQCRKEFERQQREQEERERGEGGRGSGNDNPQAEDPRQLYERCQEQCRSSRRGEQQKCQTQCRKEYEQQQREQEERERREGGRGRGDDNPQAEDPRQQYEQCHELCRKFHPHSGEVQEQCQKGCRKEYEEQRREQEEQHHGTGPPSTNHHVEQRYQQCQQKCQSQERGQRRQYCLQQCKRKYREEQSEQGHKHGEEGNISQREEEQQENNPYYFQAQSFESTFRTQHGHLRVLERFSKRSELLQGIDNYRLAILEANPNTFVVPHHYDAESIFAVLQGKGIITLVQQDRRESFNLKQGDVIRVPAGTTLYLINHDSNKKLYVAKLFQPVNTPGRFESYFGVGGENPESFYKAFSNEVLQAALNTPRERLERLFGQQKQGVIITASQEQIKALSQHVSSSSSRKSKGPFNLFNKKPLYSNEFGRFFEASPENYEQLRDLDLSVSFMNISKGAMMAPYYNSRSTKLVVVVEGTGRFEMACPHLARQSHGSQGRREEERGESGAHYQKVSARLSAGDAFIIPAGHPISIIASGNENLKLAGFGINAKNNQKNFLAGQEDNVWKHVESEAKELSFKLPAREVEEIFKNQKQSHFLPGPGHDQQQEREEGRGPTVTSRILDFVGFF